MRSSLSNILLQKVLQLVLLTETGPKVFVTTITTLLYNSHDALEETITDMKSLKLKSYQVDNFTYFCAEILVDAELLKSAGD